LLTVESSDEDNNNDSLNITLPINNVQVDSEDFEINNQNVSEEFEELNNFPDSSNSNVCINKFLLFFNKILIFL
jgi:hypothetical protein